MISRRLAAGLCLLILAAPLRAQMLSVEAYRGNVRDCLKAASGPAPLDAAPCQRLVAADGAVFPDGQTIAVDNAPLARDLRAALRSPEARLAVRERLRTMNAFLHPPASADTRDPRTQAQTILQGDEFRDAAAPPPPKSWWERFWDRVWAAIDRFFKRLFNRAPSLDPAGGRLLGQSLLYLLGGIAIAAAIVALVTLINNRTERRRRARSRLLADLEEGAGSDPLASARAHADSGDYRSALRLAYLACLRRLFDAGLLVPQDDHTNWEYQRALRSKSQEAYDTLLTVTRDFDRIWYGQMPATAADYERALAAHDALPEPHVAAPSSSRDASRGSDRS